MSKADASNPNLCLALALLPSSRTLLYRLHRNWWRRVIRFGSLLLQVDVISRNERL